MQSRFLLFGASASGKTLLCRQILKLRAGVIYISASATLNQLLRASEMGGAIGMNDKQILLCQRIRLMCAGAQLDDALIDGHLYLPLLERRVPEAAIKLLELTALMQVNEAAATISQRRRILKKPRQSLRECQIDIENEAAAGREISAKLGMPIIQVNPPASAAVTTVISSFGDAHRLRD